MGRGMGLIRLIALHCTVRKRSTDLERFDNYNYPGKDLLPLLSYMLCVANKNLYGLTYYM